MKKASKILFLIGGIVAIIMAVVFFIVAIVYFVQAGIAAGLQQTPSSYADLPESVQKALQDLIKACDAKSWEDVAKYAAGLGVLFLVVGIFAIPGAILSFIARKDNASMGLIITATAFNIVCWNPVSVVGGVLGIVDCAVNKK